MKLLIGINWTRLPRLIDEQCSYSPTIMRAWAVADQLSALRVAISESELRSVRVIARYLSCPAVSQICACAKSIQIYPNLIKFMKTRCCMLAWKLKVQPFSCAEFHHVPPPAWTWQANFLSHQLYGSATFTVPPTAKGMVPCCNSKRAAQTAKRKQTSNGGD
jgi:hypothetical protein